jgi:hypothetical protein
MIGISNIFYRKGCDGGNAAHPPRISLEHLFSYTFFQSSARGSSGFNFASSRRISFERSS